MLDKIEATLLTLANRPTLEVPGVRQVSSESVLGGLLTSVYIIAGIVAVIGIIMGGFWYVTSNGEPDKVKRGKNAIIYSVVGIVLVMLAFGITGFVSGRIGL